MRKFLFILFIVIAGLYFVLHLILASTPVQKRVVSEIQKLIQDFGYHLEIESIELSAFIPKIYLNRVALSSDPTAPVPFPAPLKIDKIKIQFQPLALFFRTILITELTLFNPKILIPEGDALYRKIKSVIAKHSEIEADTGLFTVVFKRVGVVDAVFNVESKDPAISVRSQSLTFFLENRGSDQRAIELQSSDLEIVRPPLSTVLSQVDVDLDFSPSSLRLNHAIVEGEELSLNLYGSTSLPLKKGRKKFNPSQLKATLDVKIPLALLNKIEELGLPKIEGHVASQGTVEIQQGKYSGTGKTKYQSVLIDGYRVDSGEFQYTLKDDQIYCDSAVLKFGGGVLRSPRLTVDLQTPLKASGKLNVSGLRLAKILDSVKSPDSHVDFSVSGTILAEAELAENFKVSTEVDGVIEDLAVVAEPKKDKTADNLIVALKEGKLKSQLTFFPKKMEFKGILDAAAGKSQIEGFYGFDGSAKVSVRSQDVDLGGIGKIGPVSIGGRGNLSSQFEISPRGFSLAGALDIRGLEIAKLHLGDTSGVVQYKNSLLAFEQISIRTDLEPISGSGLIDFERKLYYKFRGFGRRVPMGHLKKLFAAYKIPVQLPHEGELSARLSVEGGRNLPDVEVKVSGEAKNFELYDERWQGADYSVLYRPDALRFERLELRKRKGSVLVEGQFGEEKSNLSFTAKNFLLEEMNHTRQAPLTGVINGSLNLAGDFKAPTGSGEFRITKSAFRGTPLQDSAINVKATGGKFIYNGSFLSEKLKGKLIHEIKDHSWNLTFYFDQFNFAPFLTWILGKDIGTITEINSTGDLSFEGRGADVNELNGSGTFEKFLVNLKDSSMQSRQPIELVVRKGAWKLYEASLIGKENQITMVMDYNPKGEVKAQLDGKLDLQYLIPFLPILDYGAGKVAVGIRVGGTADKLNLVGNVGLEDGTVRLTGMLDDVQNVQAQLALSEKRANIVRLDGKLSGGDVRVKGFIEFAGLTNLKPVLDISVKEIGYRAQEHLLLKLDGDFNLRGDNLPYRFSGKCRILEGSLTSLEQKPIPVVDDKAPVMTFDIECEARDKLFVKTNIMDSELKGKFHLQGNSSKLGLLGQVETVQGNIFFRDHAFRIRSGTIKFESSTAIVPRFNISGEASVKEQKAQIPQEYQVSLLVFGTPADYKLRLSSSPALEESDIISLLVLGVTTRGQEGSYVDLGTALVGQLPLSSKLGSELGVDIRIGSQSSRGGLNPTNQALSTSSTDITVPVVQIEKIVADSTKVSLSNTLENVPVREVKIEHELKKGVTVNGAMIDKPKGNESTTVQSYGVDVRYRFQFE